MKECDNCELKVKDPWFCRYHRLLKQVLCRHQLKLPADQKSAEESTEPPSVRLPQAA